VAEHVNIKSYEGVENFATFSKEAFKEYCSTKLLTCNKHINFIKKNIHSNKIGNVLEVGSGNGKLLFALERDGFISQGKGYELSSSRVFFANEFGKLLDSKIVENIHANFLNQVIKENSVDLVIAVDLVIQLISAISHKSEVDFFKKVYSSIKPGGFFLIELMDFSKVIEMHKINNGSLRTWEEFHKNDPWQYGFYDFNIEGENIVWDKHFIARDRKMKNSQFSNILKQYSFESIKNNLIAAGFDITKIKKYNFWESENDILDEEYIVLAVKN